MGSPRITLEGRIGTDIEYRQVVSSGVARFRVITNDRKKVNKVGPNDTFVEEWEDANTTGWNIEIWGNSALKVKNHLEKGDPIVLAGVIFEDKWTGKDGEQKSTFLIKADYIGLDVGKAKTQ